MRKIILDLCGGTGSWSKPWADAGYEVWNITIPGHDVRYFLQEDDRLRWLKEGEVVGILAAPPCTMFSDARTKAKTPRDLRGGMEIVEACLKIIREFQYRTFSDQQKYPPLKFWALENPYFGRLKWFLGEPKFVFDPYEFGDGYKKRTAIWGYFKEPKKKPVEMTKDMIEKCKTNSRPLPKFDYMKSKDIHPEFYKKFDRQTRRAITPQGFAQAFYEANK